VEIPEKFYVKWQDTIDLIARIYDVPTSLIMRVHEKEIEVFLSSNSLGTPYAPGQRENLGKGLYCEAVMESKDHLHVPNALHDVDWQDNPDIKLGMISYLGVPLVWPDGRVFGTLCVLDTKTRNFSGDYIELIKKMKCLIEQDFSSILTEEEMKADLLQTQGDIKGIIDNIPSDIALINKNLIYRTANRTYLEKYNLTPETLNGTHLKDVISEFHWESLREYIASVLQGNIESFEFEFPFNKGERYSKVVLVPNFCSHGKVCGFYYIGTDIHDLKLAKYEIRQRANELQVILDSLPALVSCVDANLRYLMVNESYLKTFGFNKKEDIIGLHVKNVLTETVLDKIKDKLDRVLAGERVTFDIDCEFFDGKVHHCNITYLPSFDEHGNVNHFYVFMIDITERKIAETLIHHSEKMQAIGLLAGGIAHDFNNMLGIISASAEIISEKEKEHADPQSILCLENILETVARGSDLATKLVTFGGEGNIKSQPINVHDAINRTIEILKRTVDKSITISKKANAKKTTIMGNNAALENILLNIGINASHALKKGGDFTITTKNIILKQEDCNKSAFNLVPGEYIDIELHDTGIGIPEQDQTKVFDPFFTTKEANKGVGLGLASVYGTVKDFHGSVFVKSRLDEGTSFHLQFPCTTKNIENTTQIPKVIPGTQRRILFVDDEYELSKTIELMLVELGYHVVLANSGYKAIEIFNQQQGELDLIIMDVNMPKMSGHEAIKKLRKIDKKIPIIISTGFSNKNTQEDIKDLDVATTIHKPYRMAELSAVLSQVFDNAQQR